MHCLYFIIIIKTKLLKWVKNKYNFFMLIFNSIRHCQPFTENILVNSVLDKIRKSNSLMIIFTHKQHAFNIKKNIYHDETISIFIIF